MVGNTGFIERLDDEIRKAYAYEVSPSGCMCVALGSDGPCDWCVAYEDTKGMEEYARSFGEEE